jgi:hypothetical protein
LRQIGLESHQFTSVQNELVGVNLECSVDQHAHPPQQAGPDQLLDRLICVCDAQAALGRELEGEDGQPAEQPAAGCLPLQLAQRRVQWPGDPHWDAARTASCNHLPNHQSPRSQVHGLRTLPLMADDIDLTRTRELSRNLFGGANYRIEIAAAIAESDGLVCMVDLVRQLGDPPGKSSVNAELKVLEKAGLLGRPDARRGGRIYLLREDSPFWEMCRQLLATTAHPEAHQT